MKVIDSRGDTDFVWEREVEVEPTTLIAYYQNEQGFASFIAGASLIGGGESVCSILSKLHQVEPMNTIPAPTFPEWRLYELRNEDGRRYFVLRINHAYIPAPNHTKAWLYNYPVFRDIVTVLSEKGVDELVYLTANIMQEYIYQEQAQIPSDELLVYDYDEKDDSLFLTDGTDLTYQDLDIPPPSWIVAECFEKFNTNPVRGNYIVMCASTATTFINEREAERLLQFLEDTHALMYDEKYKGELLEVLYEAEASQVVE